ncbi:hypothetical protein KS4_23510 [Poriferisphaera corsica]|uniref:Helix-turn-helix domain-containing protein n=1 Tax=Poriferisphaera corsica TaxID=2528020 RepID=A0A517YVM7_9BACT|nr:helix-turn-helix domain-containing protein [Poriferisphaera corsica]QDU34284.1 hypothetical protein KS4_23510 [Poriferisphaera corsica]
MVRLNKEHIKKHEDIMTLQEAATYICVGVRKFNSLRDEYELQPFYVGQGGKLYYHRDQLDHLLTLLSRRMAMPKMPTRKNPPEIHPQDNRWASEKRFTISN